MKINIKIIIGFIILIQLGLIAHGIISAYDGNIGYGLFMVGLNSAFAMMNLLTLTRN